MVKADADSKRNQASEDPAAPRRISSADRAALEAAKAIEADQRMATAEREMAARKLPAAGKPSSSTFHIGKLTRSTFHIGKPSSSTFQSVVDKPEIVRTPQVESTIQVERTLQVERTIQALKRFQNGEPSAYFSTKAMSIKYDTSGDMFTVIVYSFPEGKRDAQCEMILMNEDEGQVAQRLTTLAADGMNLESRVCR